MPSNTKSRSTWVSTADTSLCRWLSIRLETLGALSAFSAAALAVEQGGAASVVGLSLSYALQITQLTNMTVSAAVAATLWHPRPTLTGPCLCLKVQ
jgi:hypothetical protein